MVWTHNMDQSHEYIREGESWTGAHEMSECSLPSMFHPPVIKIKIGKGLNQVIGHNGEAETKVSDYL